jgi:hypothetical protein
MFAAIALTFVLWLIFRLALPAGPYEMDHGGKEGAFFPHLIMYSVFGYVQVALGIGGAVYGASLGRDWHPGFILLLAASCALLWVGLMAFFFEGYMTERYPGKGKLAKSNYSIGKYAAVLSLGFSSFALLIIGGMWLAAEVGR